MSTTTVANAAASDEDGSETAAKEGRFRIDFSRAQVGNYKGLSMFYIYQLPEVQVPKVMKLSLRDNDIVLLTYPKSGTHWAWRVLDMLATGSATYSNRSFISFFLDVVPTEVIDRASSDFRRILSTHLPFDFLPAQVKDGRVKVVHMYRNPKAVLVSLTFQLRYYEELRDTTLDQQEAMMNAGQAPYKNQFYYLDKVKEFERDNPNVDIFHLAYEDMQQDTVGCIKKLAAYLNVDASDELCSNIAEAVSFSRQKKQEEELDVQANLVGFYRKGDVDDWKNHMTVAQSERMDKVLADRAASCQFCRRYCPAITTDQGHVYRLSSDN